MTTEVLTWIYKSRRKPDLFVYLAEKDDFECLPESLRSIMGQLEFVMEIILTKERKLAKEDVIQVMDRLISTGFYIQMPKEWTPDMYFGNED